MICSLSGPLSHGSPVVVFFDRGHPRFWNFYSTIPVDVVRVKSYVNCLFDSARVVIRVNKLYFVPGSLCPVLCACSETAEVSIRASRMSLSCSLILSCIGLPVFPMYTLPHSQGILPSCLAGSTASFARTNSDLSVVSDLKTARTPC